MKNELNKAIIFCLIMLLFFSFASLNGFYGHSSDNEAHKQMALDDTINPTYPPLLRTISSFFVSNEQSWVFFIMFLFAFLTPLLLVKITGSWWSALFYFSITSQFYWVIQGGFAQGLLLMFVLGLFAFKDNKIRIPIYLIGLISHSFAPILLTSILILILLNENWEMIKQHFNGFRNVVFGGCSALLGQNAVDDNSFFHKTLNTSTLTGTPVTYWGQAITPWSLLTLLGKICPIFFAVPAFLKLWALKRTDLLILVVFGLIASIQYGTRTWYLLFIPLIIGFTLYWKDLESKRIKKAWLGLTMFYLTFQLFMWINFNLNC